MSRPVVLSNGELHVGLNEYGLVHDFYFPYVGLENHAADNALRHHIGVWIDGRISWLDNGEWKFEFSYPHQALISHITATNPNLQVRLEFDDTVDTELSALMRNVHIVNESCEQREIKLFMHQAFIIGDSASNTDTVQYIPSDHAMLHYRGRRAFIVSGRMNTGEWFDQYTCGLFGIEGHEGTHKDAEDGELTMCNVEHGRVDSTLRFAFTLGPFDSTRMHYWIACGTSLRESLYVHKQIQKQGYIRRFELTASSWHKWLRTAQPTIDTLPEKYRAPFTRSLLITKAHIDKRGAVIASTDSAMLQHWRDVYAYTWPRDGAYVVWPLIRLGYYDEPYRFFDFCRRGLNAGGYLSHKYRADGALGSSWHSYLQIDGRVAPPIQTDETASVLFVFTQFYQSTEDPKLLHDFYESLVVPMADFLTGYVEDKTKLPKASYDLWEERYLTTVYTTAVTYAALLAAANLAEHRKDLDSVVKWRNAAEAMAEQARNTFYDPALKCFIKGVDTDKAGNATVETAIDMSAIYGAFMYGLFAADSPEVRQSMETAKQAFGFDPAWPGMPRYENDNYQRSQPDRPNTWPIISLWLAQYSLEQGDTELATTIIDWVTGLMRSTGVLPEQICPANHQNMSVEPLTWTQAEYLSTLLDLAAGK